MAAQAFEKALIPRIDRAAGDTRVTHEDDGDGGDNDCDGGEHDCDGGDDDGDGGEDDGEGGRAVERREWAGIEIRTAGVGRRPGFRNMPPPTRMRLARSPPAPA